MALEVNRLGVTAEHGSAYRVPARLYWVADRSRLVRHGDPEAAFLAFPAGAELSIEEARRFRLLDTVDTPVTPEKLRAEPENKRGARPADKAAGKVAAVKETT